MKKYFIFLIFLLFFIFLAGTISPAIETNYYIYQDKVLVKHFFDSVSDLELKIPKDFDKLEVNSQSQLEEFSKYYLIKINSTNNLSINYITKSMIDKSGENFYFISRNYLNEFQNVRLVLPEFAVLSEKGIVFPEPNLISSDGRSIILEWSNYNEKQIIVDYEFVKKKNFIFYILILIIVLAFVSYLIFQRKIFKKKIEKIKDKAKKNKKSNLKSEIIEEHLVESEKRIINELKKAEKNQLWQKQLQTQTGFSKAKLSRTIRNLESRNLIQKIPMGNTNKIKLKIK